MATVATNVTESVYQIRRWKGVNEAQEGEASLDMGEAAVMRNFKVTAGGALQKRGGSRTIAGLMSEYAAVVDTGTTRVLLTEANASTASLTMYSAIEVDSVGNISPAGESAQVTNENQADYIGWYYQDEEGAVYRFTGVRS